AHVISDDQKVHNELGNPPVWSQAAQIHFEVEGKDFKVAEVICTSPPDALDFTLARLSPRLTKWDACPLNTAQKQITDLYPRVYVIGHPGGRELTFSLSDNVVLGFRTPRLHYRTPTEGGSSGSPVFTVDWDVLALHHAGALDMPKLSGKGRYAANEGIWMSAIKQHLARRKKTTGKRPR